MRLPLLAAIAALVALPAHAGRPLTIDDAEPTAFGAYELELGLLSSKAPGERHFDLPVAFAYGLTPAFEIGAGWGVHLRDRLADFNNDTTVSGPVDLVLGFKWTPVHTDAGVLVALAGAAKLATVNEHKGLGTGDEDYDLTLIVTKQWNTFAIDGNLGRTWVGDRFDTTLADRPLRRGGALLRQRTADPGWRSIRRRSQRRESAVASQRRHSIRIAQELRPRCGIRPEAEFGGTGLGDHNRIHVNL